MKKIQLLTILSLFFGIIACNNSDIASEKLILSEKKMLAQNDKNVEFSSETIKELDTIKKINTSAVSISEQKMEKRNKKPSEVGFLTEDVQLDEKNYITSGYVRNEFIKDGSIYHFKRVVKLDEDRRVGCSGGGNELSFTIINPVDTFLIENEALQKLNFQYSMNGGLYWEVGKNPFKGYIKGTLSPEKTWQIEINVWIKMTDFQLNKEIERQIIVHDTFNL